MLLKINIRDIEDSVLNPLNEILLLSYGTDVYKIILGKIGHCIDPVLHRVCVAGAVVILLYIISMVVLMIGVTVAIDITGSGKCIVSSTI